MYDYDTIIIGGGHNGLVAAAYLAKAGKKVCILERRDILGGCSSTEELWPGFKISPAAYVISLFLPQIIKDLKLKSNGLNILPRIPISSYTPDLTGPGLLLGNNRESNYQEISLYSKSDAENYEKYENFLTEIIEVVEPLLEMPVPHVLPIGRKIGFFARLKEMMKAYSFYKKIKKLGNKLPDAVELLTGAATPILERWFESDILKATLATDAIIGSFTSPANPGSAYVLLHHLMGDIGYGRGNWGYVEGGMGGLAEALEKVCRELGVRIFKGREVMSIDVENESNPKVLGVSTTEGAFYSAKSVASSIDSHWTFEKFILPKYLPEEFLERIKNISYSSASAKINLALDSLPFLIGSDDKGREGYYTGTIHISPDLKYIERAYHDAKMGRFSSRPVLEVTIPTVLDHTIAPAGKHIMSIFVQYAPYELDRVEWDGGAFGPKDVLYDTCIRVLEEYFPGIKKKILHRQILTPVDLEKTYRLTGGNIFQGEMSFHQLGPFRNAGWGYHTPVEGLYMCGAAVHPGGGVLGACGKNAAEVILRESK